MTADQLEKNIEDLEKNVYKTEDSITGIFGEAKNDIREIFREAKNDIKSDFRDLRNDTHDLHEFLFFTILILFIIGAIVCCTGICITTSIGISF